jgi:hypothetical protein
MFSAERKPAFKPRAGGLGPGRVPVTATVPNAQDPSWNTVLRGSSKVGAAAPGPEFSADFLVVDARNRPMGWLRTATVPSRPPAGNVHQR